MDCSITTDGKVFDLIATHRSACVVRDAARAEFECEKDETPLEDLMITVVKIERGIFEELLAATPTSVEELTAMVRYVDEVNRKQSERGHSDCSPEILIANLTESVRMSAAV